MRKSLVYFLFFANLIGIFYIWINGSGSLLVSGDMSNILIALGRIGGLLAEYFILVQLVLVGRIRFIEQVFGFDKLNIIHRRLGYTIGATILLHPLLITWGYALGSNQSFVAQFYTFLLSWEDVFFAFLGLVIILIIVTISIAIIRRKLKYETWYFSHLFIYLAIALAFSHQIATGDINGGGILTYWYILNFTIFGLVLVYRVLRPLYITYTHRFYLEKIVRETDTVHSFYINGNKMEEYSFQPGQYMHITFLAPRFWYSHPFSFSQAPNGEHLRLSIKSSGDFTSTIHTVPAGTRVIIDGPFGVFTEKKAQKEKFLFIAGGIGITPIRSLIESLSKKGRDMILLYGNKTEKDIAFKKELENFKVTMHHVLSDTTNTQFERGFIDQEKIMRLAPDFMEREIYVCGPPVMMKGIVKTLLSMGVPRAQLHYEKFSY